MANFETLKTAIDANINTNGKQAITGSVVNNVMHQMVDATSEQLTELESKVEANKIKAFNKAKLFKGYFSSQLMPSDYWTTTGLISVDSVVYDGKIILSNATNASSHIDAAVFKLKDGSFAYVKESFNELNDIPSDAEYVAFNFFTTELEYVSFGAVEVKISELDSKIETNKDYTESRFAELASEINSANTKLFGVVELKKGYMVSTLQPSDNWKTTGYIRIDSVISNGEIVLNKVTAFSSSIPSISFKLNDGSYMEKYESVSTLVSADIPSDAEFVAFNFFEIEDDYVQFKSLNTEIAELNIKASEIGPIKKQGVFKEVGLLAFNLLFKENKNTIIFTNSDVNVGDKVYYNIRLLDSDTNGNAYISLYDSNRNLLAEYGKPYISHIGVLNGHFFIPEGFAYAEMYGTLNAMLDYVGNDKMPDNVRNELISLIHTYDDKITALQESISSISGVTNVNVINKIAFPNEPIRIMSNTDADATELDNALLSYSKILKISDNMYYLYYTSFGKNQVISDVNQNLCFAYSTDGFNYHRGFPDGINPPIPGTNKLVNFSLIEMDVVRVQDSEYPYRMVGNIKVGDRTQVVTLFKSSDAINFTKIAELTKGGNDCQNSVIVRGNTLKIFVRAYTSGRCIGIMHCDIWGNKYYDYKPAISFASQDNQIYQASASVLDDHRELLLPSIYNPTTSEMHIECMILNGERYDMVSVDTSNIQGSADKTAYVMPGTININGDIYILVGCEDTDHDSYNKDLTKSYLKLVKMELS